MAHLDQISQSKLSFSIVACTGEEPGCLASELELQHRSPGSQGWQSPSYSASLQELVLRLHRPSRLLQLQLLSHESKIASRVEIYVGMLPPDEPDLRRCSWRRLGFLSFDSNERSGYLARELKSVHLDSPACAIRLAVHRCHANALNPTNQVGLVALTLLGQPLDSSLYQVAVARSLAESPSPLSPPGNPEQQHRRGSLPAPLAPLRSVSPVTPSGPAAALASLGLGVDVDPVTGAQLGQLQLAKQAAVASEDYDEAKRLKSTIDRLLSVVDRLAALESAKKAAVVAEDYDAAKAAKADIDRVRASAGLSTPGSAGDKDNSWLRRNADLEVRNRAVSGTSSNLRQALSPIANGVPRGADPDSAASLPSPPRGSVSPTGASTHAAYDDRPTGGKGAYNLDSDLGADALPPGATPPNPKTARAPRPAKLVSKPRGHPVGVGGVTAGGLPKPASAATASPGNSGAPSGGGERPDGRPVGWPSELQKPEPLSIVDAGLGDPLEPYFGEWVARALFSSSWQQRDAALNFMTTAFLSGGPAKAVEAVGARDLWRALYPALAKGIKDRVANTVTSSLKVLQAVLTQKGALIGGRNVARGVAELLPSLVERVGESNVRLKEAALEAVRQLAALPESGLLHMTAVIVKPVKSQSAWQPVLGRLQLIRTLLSTLGVVTSSSQGFVLEDLMRFLNAAFTSAKVEVRSAAQEVAVSVAGLVGPPLVLKMLPAPPRLNAKLLQQLTVAISTATPTAKPSPPAKEPMQTPPVAPPSKQPGGSVPAAPRASSASRGPPAAAFATQAPGYGSRPPLDPAAQQQQTPTAPSQTLDADSSIPPGQTQDGLPLAINDDPAIFETELRRREAALGSMHPAVAETASNLAIIYNQMGDYAKAQPLYEKALAIWEVTLGADHPDVAHTLTDLAVLHLEQGRDDVGRPLLERALIVQEKILGHDHPDVVAIRDVLDSEED